MIDESKMIQNEEGVYELPLEETEEIYYKQLASCLQTILDVFNSEMQEKMSTMNIKITNTPQTLEHLDFDKVLKYK